MVYTEQKDRILLFCFHTDLNPFISLKKNIIQTLLLRTLLFGNRVG